MIIVTVTGIVGLNDQVTEQLYFADEPTADGIANNLENDTLAAIVRDHYEDGESEVKIGDMVIATVTQDEITLIESE